MLIRCEYANRDLGDGVCVVMNNYCSLGTLLEFTKEFPTKMAKKIGTIISRKWKEIIKNKNQNKNPNKQKKGKKLFSPDKPGNCLQETSVQLEGLYQEEILWKPRNFVFSIQQFL